MNNKLFKEFYNLLDFKANNIDIAVLFNYFVYGECTLAPEKVQKFIAYKKEEEEIRLLPVIGIKEYKNVYQRISNILTEFPHIFAVSDNMQEPSQKLNILLKKYDIPIDTDYKTNIINLLNYCFPEKLFPNYRENSLKSTTLNHTYGFEKAVVKLEKFLREHSKVIISEEPGSGKTHFIKYFLALCCQNDNTSSEWKGTFKDVFYVEYNGNIESTLQTISTLENYESKDDFPSACNFSNSLLVIDCMYYRENFKDDLEYLSSLPFKIIVITHSGNNNIAGFCRFPFFPKLTDTDLISIFMTYGKLNNNKEAIQKNWPRIKSLTHNNPFIISLLAKQYYLKPDEKSLNHLLTTLEQPNLKHDSNKVFRFNNDTANMTGHIRKIFINLIEMNKLNKASNDNSDTNANLIFIAACISYFGWEKIPKSFLKEVIPCVYDFDTAIDSLSQTGILSSDSISVQMPVLIVYSLQYYPISKDNGAVISYKNIMQLTKNLNNYLEKPSSKDPYLGNILLHFARILYDKAKVKNNPQQYSTSDDFELWQKLLQNISFYYHTYGNFNAGTDISELFKFPTDVQNRSSKINLYMIKLEAFLVQCKNPGTDEYAKTLADYIDSICQLMDAELIEDLDPSSPINSSKSNDSSTKFNHKYYGVPIGLINLVDMNISLFFFTKLCKIIPNCRWIGKETIKWINDFYNKHLDSLNIYPEIKKLFPTNCDSDYQIRYYDFVNRIIYKEGEVKNDITVQKDITYYMNESFFKKSNTEKNLLLRGIAISLYALYFELPNIKYNDLPQQELKVYVNRQISRFEQGINCCRTISYETLRISFNILAIIAFHLSYNFQISLDYNKYIEKLSKKCPYITSAKDDSFHPLE